MNSESQNLRQTRARIGGTHGYRIDGDLAVLNAELDIDTDAASRTNWALQLWACENPHLGGPLAGIKVAEAPFELESGAPDRLRQCGAESLARLPADRRNYAMVLVLASGAPGAFEQVHDFVNFGERASFDGPHFEGTVGYTIQNERVLLCAHGVRNPRPLFNFSGSLSLGLWAFEKPYAGGALDGVLLAKAELERLSGQQSLDRVEHFVPFAAPPAGVWHIALVLCEWTELGGLVARDFCQFPTLYETAVAKSEPSSALRVTGEPMLAKLAAEKAPEIAPKASQPPVGSAAPEVQKAIEAKAAVEAKAAIEAKPAAAPEAAKAEVAAPEAAKAEVAAPEAAKAAVAAPEAAKAAVAATAAVPSAAVARAAGITPASGVASPEKPSIQTASIDQLLQVSGVTQKIALEIIRSRPFKSAEDLLKVRGVGEGLLKALRQHLRF